MGGVVGQVGFGSVGVGTIGVGFEGVVIGADGVVIGSVGGGDLGWKKHIAVSVCKTEIQSL